MRGVRDAFELCVVRHGDGREAGRPASLVIGGAAIAALLRTLRAHDPWALQPACLSEGRTSHPITAARHGTTSRIRGSRRA
jgi:hypothetical protein